MPINWGALSDTGMWRTANEDSYFADGQLFVVADGMGGHNAGEVASAMTVKLLQAAHTKGFTDATNVAQVVKEINEAVFSSATQQPDRHGMGTTVTLMVVLPAKEPSAVVANIGDSRTYLLRDNEMRQISVDHSYVQELVAQGIISREEARTHARRNIVTRAIGIDQDVAVDVWTLPLVTGDRYLLCSDGLVDEVNDLDIEKCLRQFEDPQQVAKELVALANENGGRDNITVIIADVKSDEPINTNAENKVTKNKKSLVRKIIIPAIFASLFMVSAVLLVSYARSGFYVGYENSKPDARILIFRGKNIAWLRPTIEADSTLIRSDLSTGLQKEITGNPAFNSPLAAQSYVNQIRDVVEDKTP